MASNDIAKPVVNSSWWARWSCHLTGAFLFAVVLAAGTHMTNLESTRRNERQYADLLDFGSLLSTRITHELSSVLYLSSGLSSYMVVRSKSQDRREIGEILSRLYSESRHVRNFGIAIGTTLTYVYPVEGNERAIGLRYSDIPAQWPGVKATIDSGKPFLAGPINLVQGGRGLIYRVPIIVDGKYWGLLSTVVNSDSLFNAAFANIDTNRFSFALKGNDAGGRRGGIIWGNETIFNQPGTETIDIEVPGGTWALAVKVNEKGANGSSIWQMRALTWLLALLSGWYVYQLLHQRKQLAQMALYDALTGLPNRRIIEDRAQRTILQQRRDKSKISALLVFDLNGFKLVNDRQGHKAGDLVLQVVATRVSETIRSVDTIGRWGGDEFVVVLPDVDRTILPNVVDRIQKVVGLPIGYDQASLQVSASIGMAIIPDDGVSFDELIKTADQRMYANKLERDVR